MNQSQILIEMVIKSWNQQISRAEKYFDAKSDEALEQQIAPNKNRLIYLLGHLVASNDSMITLFGIGERLYPQYEEIFSRNPDKAFPTPPVAELRKAWKDVHEALSRSFNSMTVDQWLSKHTAMTDEDLAKEPTRNKLSVMISRTNHVAYHLGQIILVR